MIEWLTLAFLSVGFAFNLAGLFLGAKAFLATWHEFGEGPLWPWFTRTKTGVANFLRQLNPWQNKDATKLNVEGEAHVTAGGSIRVDGRASFPWNTSDSELIRQLVIAVEGIYDVLSEERKITQQRDREVREQFGQLKSQLSVETARREGLARQMAVGDVRVQLAALVCIGIGTVLSAVPAIWNVLAALG